jgi:hypothetical protein
MGGHQDGANALFYDPEMIAAYGDSVYVTEYWGSTVRRVHLADGKVETTMGSFNQAGMRFGKQSDARVNRPYGIAVDATGLYVSTAFEHSIGVLR